MNESTQGPAKILIDTNFLLTPLEFNIDLVSQLDRLFGSYQLYMFNESYLELEKLYAEQRGKRKRLVKLALSFIEHLKKTKGLKILFSQDETYLDDTIVSFVEKDKDYYIATDDKGLQARLKNKCLGLVYVRQKSYLGLRKFYV